MAATMLRSTWSACECHRSFVGNVNVCLSLEIGSYGRRLTCSSSLLFSRLFSFYSWPVMRPRFQTSRLFVDCQVACSSLRGGSPRSLWAHRHIHAFTGYFQQKVRLCPCVSHVRWWIKGVPARAGILKFASQRMWRFAHFYTMSTYNVG